jgi:hypothetical protein
VDVTKLGEAMFAFEEQGPFCFSDGKKTLVKLSENPDQATHVMHMMTMTEVPLPKAVIENIGDAKLAQNYSYHTSTVSIDELHMHIPTKSLFVKEGLEDIFDHEDQYNLNIGKRAVAKLQQQAAGKPEPTVSTKGTAGKGGKAKKPKARFSARRVIAKKGKRI